MNIQVKAALIEGSRPQTSVQKIYVLDTNVLLHDPLAVHAFAEHKVIIPMTVLEELDHIKDRREKDVSREARLAINTIDKLLANASTREIQDGVEIFSPVEHNQGQSGTLAIFPDQILGDVDHETFLRATEAHDNDNRIINVALLLQKENPKQFVCLVTKDINMRLKARGSGLSHVEDYRNDKVLDDIDLLSSGKQQFKGSFWDRIENVRTLQKGRDIFYHIDRNALSGAYPNQFVMDEDGFLAKVVNMTPTTVELQDTKAEHLMNRSIWGLSPRNLEQAMAINLLEQQNLDLNILVGQAGSGKTLLALSYGLHAILEEKRYSKLIVARSTPPMAEDIGFLPGTEEEKMAPWLAAFDDNLEVLHNADESPYGSVQYVKERANIQFKSLNFMRGRSFNNAYIIIDEAQGLTQFQLKSIITRVGTNSKIVILGNLAQIDNKYITPLTSRVDLHRRTIQTFRTIRSYAYQRC